MVPRFRGASQVGLGPRGAGPAAAQQRCGVPLRGHRRAEGRASDATGAGGTRRLGRGNHGKMMGKWRENDGKMDIWWEISWENHGKWWEIMENDGNTMENHGKTTWHLWVYGTEHEAWDIQKGHLWDVYGTILGKLWDNDVKTSEHYSHKWRFPADIIDTWGMFQRTMFDYQRVLDRNIWYKVGPPSYKFVYKPH